MILNMIASSKTQPLKVTIETQGCKLNQADSSVIANQFTKAGHILSKDVASSDIFILNTCTVTHIADRKARKSIRYAKKSNPNIKIIVTGCYAENTPEILKNMPEVDHVIGNQNKTKLFDNILSTHPKPIEKPATNYNHSSHRSRLMVKIQEGCDQICAYCIIPKVRGREKSVDPNKIIDLIKQK